MKTLPRFAPALAGWALAANLFGLTGAAFAQYSPYAMNRGFRPARPAPVVVEKAIPLPVPPSRMVPGISSGNFQPGSPAPALPEAQARLVEMRVELAWLADPATFPYPLAAQVKENRLVLGGVVPSEAIRNQAYVIAYDHAGLPLEDKLKVDRVPVPRTSQPTDQLQQAAAADLAKAFPKFGRDLKVQAASNGQVLVTGSVPSVEDKLAISRRLSGLAGCHGVVNHAAVSPSTREGKSCALVTADGRHTIAAEALPRDAAVPIIFQMTEQASSPVAPVPPGAVKPAAWTAVEQPAAPKEGRFSLRRKDRQPVTPEVIQVANSEPTGVKRWFSGLRRSPAPEPMITQAPSPKPMATPPFVSAGARKNTNVPPMAMPGRQPAQPGTVSPAALKKQIESVCGRSARDVQVTPQGENVLHVRLKVRTVAEGEKLAPKVLGMPVLGPYQVNLDIHVGM